ncbi:helix-turn-helix transcriptional regulator [Cucumibacter marinus]|uniref:helix-turn-helix transcriptional regulator n=1 Tax=Cucumibacter marinus TaxID=1121252 RepID=UPI0003F8F123|nr:metalloregulator ArsR/SmtB family transcription factor [Cucumibacter marinus]
MTNQTDMTEHPENTSERGGHRLLFALKSRGELTAADLARLMKVTTVAIRQQLDRLEGEGLVDFEDRAEGVGRPRRYWRLTEAGHGRFPDRHSDLTLEVLTSVKSLFGEDGLDKVIAAREARSRELYGAAVDTDSPLADRVATLADLRQREGYMAQVEPDGEGGFFLHENHCPICAAATACQGLCRAELTLFQAVLGADTEIRRESHIVSGARRCTYRIRERQPETA